MPRMYFFEMENSVNPSEIGCSPQIETMTLGYKYDAPDSIWELSYAEGMELNLSAFKMQKRAKATDRLSAVGIPSFYAILISSKFIEVLSDFSIASHSLYRAEVVKMGKKMKDYFLLKFNESAAHHIKTERSKFFLFDNLTSEKKPIDLNEKQLIAALNQWENSGIIKHPNSLKAEKIVFKPGIKVSAFFLSLLAHHNIFSMYTLKAVIHLFTPSLVLQWLWRKVAGAPFFSR